jgi:hypothetical protein
MKKPTTLVSFLKFSFLFNEEEIENVLNYLINTVSGAFLCNDEKVLGTFLSYDEKNELL